VATYNRDIDERGTDKDEGRFFAGPYTIQRSNVLKNGNIVTNYSQTGVVITNNPRSPWRDATLFIQGTTIRDSKENLIQEVALYETVDAEGDVTWSTMWRPAGDVISLRLRSGTGKWLGITGNGHIFRWQNRADDHFMPQWEMHWKIDLEHSRGAGLKAEKGTYMNYDRGFSIHGRHIADFTKNLANGVTLVANHQPFAVRLSDDVNVVSPRNFATGVGRGTTIRKNDRILGDILLLEDTDPDGDITWLFHEWWYMDLPGTGPASGYWYLGGTGKWKGIIGVGKPLGRIRHRNDENNMLRVEISWTVEN
jgi:hypothetical protein